MSGGGLTTEAVNLSNSSHCLLIDLHPGRYLFSINAKFPVLWNIFAQNILTCFGIVQPKEQAVLDARKSMFVVTYWQYGHSGPRILVDCPLDPLSFTAFPVHRSGSVLDEASHGSASASGHTTYIQTAELGLVDPATVDCVLLTNFHNMQALREDPKKWNTIPYSLHQLLLWFACN